MPSVRVLPGIQPRSVQHFYKGWKVEKRTDVLQDPAVHSIYECRALSEGAYTCPYQLAIVNVNPQVILVLLFFNVSHNQFPPILKDNRGEYKEIGCHTHGNDETQYRAGLFIASLFFEVESNVSANLEDLFDSTLVKCG
jgi:hypothetical protein